MRRLSSLSIIPLMVLAACDGHDQTGGNGTDINISGEGGNVVAAANGKTGNVSLKVPGLSANITLPKLNIGADNLDIDGVKLYPGSTVSGMDIRDGGPGQEDKVNIRFAAPAAPDKVRDYFLANFTKNGATVAGNSQGLAGKSKEGEPFTVTLSPDGKGGSAGVLTAASKD
jgi:hypothetical protein